MTETATATNPTDAAASTEASATLLSTQSSNNNSTGAPATAGSGTGETQQTQTTETQTPQATETSTKETKTAETAAAAGAPETYEFKAPDGTEYDSAILETFSGAAKEANLPQDAAQKLIETMAPALAARQADQVQALQKEWMDASKADKEFGGDKLQENLAVARKAYDTFDPIPSGQTTTPLRTLLEKSGLGNHPEIIRLLFRAGKAISEDKFVGGAPGGKGAASPASVLYDKTTQKG